MIENIRLIEFGEEGITSRVGSYSSILSSSLTPENA